MYVSNKYTFLEAYLSNKEVGADTYVSNMKTKGNLHFSICAALVRAPRAKGVARSARRPAVYHKRACLRRTWLLIAGCRRSCVNLQKRPCACIR